MLAHDQVSGAVVGYAQALWEEGGPVAALVVDPDHRRHGIGDGAVADARGPDVGTVAGVGQR